MWSVSGFVHVAVLTLYCLRHKLEMASSDWHLSLKLVDQPKSTFHFPEMMPGDVPPGGYRVAALKQLVAAQLADSIPDPELIGLLQHQWQKWNTTLFCQLRPRITLVCGVLVCIIRHCYLSLLMSSPELVHCGRKLKDDLTLDACGIRSGSTLHILKKTWPEPESSPGLCVCHLSSWCFISSVSGTKNLNPNINVCTFALL